MRHISAAMLTLTLVLYVLPSGASAADAVARRPASAWLETALAETRQQKAWESTHPFDRMLFTGAGQYLERLYGQPPSATFVAGPLEFITWWQETGTDGMERWADDGFPMILDRDHLIYSGMALYSAQCTPRTQPTIYVNGSRFTDPGRFWAYYDRIKTTGTEVYRRALTGGDLSQEDYGLLRLYAPIIYTMWGAPYLPCALGLTSGDTDHYPVPGMVAPDFTLPRLESVLKSRDYTDAYTFDYQRAFHSEIAAFLLHVCAGYTPISEAERVAGGPSIRARPYRRDDADAVTLSASRGKKPVLLVFNDPIDGYWASTIPFMEPLYQATKDRIDWFFICDDICDNIYWNTYYFPPNQGAQTFQKAISMEERAQIAKSCLCMNFPNLGFPVLLDDLAQHAQTAYTDGGGIAKVILIDKAGVITLNNRLFDLPRNYIENSDPFGFRPLTRAHCVAAANVKELLDHGGLWSGKEALVPDWQPSASIENARITAIDAAAGTITLSSPTSQDITVAVEKDTRIIFSASPNVCRTIAELAVGATISCTYAASASAAGRSAGLILSGASLNDYLTSPLGQPYKPWCPAIATAVDGSMIEARLAPRSRSELRGLRFWEEAGPGASAPTWEAQLVKGWMDHPEQKLTLHVDRATEVIVNGNRGRISDIQVGDRLGVEFRQDQDPGNLRPLFIFVYRFEEARVDELK